MRSISLVLLGDAPIDAVRDSDTLASYRTAAAEYPLVVRWRIDRAAKRAGSRDAVGALARRIGSGGGLALYGVAAPVLIVAVRFIDHRAIASVVILTLGALHRFFDGVIWRSPARSQPIPTGSSADSASRG